MITEQQLLAQMEALIGKAKNAPSEQLMRDEIVALKAMCDLFLSSPTVTYTTSTSTKENSFVQSPALAKAPVRVVESKLEDDGANGDSIFDF